MRPWIRKIDGAEEKEKGEIAFSLWVPVHKIVFHAIETPFVSIGREGDPWFTAWAFSSWPKETLSLSSSLQWKPRKVARGGWTRGFETRHISRLDKLNEIAWTCSEQRGLMGTTRNYRDVGQDFDAVRQGSNLKVDADTLSLSLSPPFSPAILLVGAN